MKIEQCNHTSAILCTDCEQKNKAEELENAAREFCLLIRIHNQEIKRVLSPNEAIIFLNSFVQLERLL